VRRLLSVSLLFAACGFPHGSLGPRDGDTTGGDDDGDIDAPLFDAMPDTPDDNCYARGSFYTCLQAPPTGAVTLQGNINTTLCTAETTGAPLTGTAMMTSDGTAVCVFTAASFTMAAASSVGVFGAKPLVLIASGNITVPAATTLDASTVKGAAAEDSGPNANPSDCGNRPSGGANAAGGGGGAGGTFGTKGGNGGNGGGATGGVASAVPTPFNKLRGGCPGGNGGTGGAGSTTAVGGSGGGAVALFSHGTIQIDGTITVNGAGGQGGFDSKGGAGGGGSGGMVVLHAMTINMGAASRIMANGGGGGAGSGNSSDGDDGADATLMDTAASGGVFATSGTTPGGAGAVNATGAVTPGNSANGGPGAGGGLGVIRVLSGQSLPSARTSPDAIGN
jgi:hypothetical protein